MLNGFDTIMFPIHTKTEDFCLFLQEIRKNNPINRICLILDNFATHKANGVRKKAKDLNIELIYLPPYSPDLNPIERIWLTMKARWFNNYVCKNEEQLIERLDQALLDVINNPKRTQRTTDFGTLF